MNRRDFIKNGLVITMGGLLVPKYALSDAALIGLEANQESVGGACAGTGTLGKTDGASNGSSGNSRLQKRTSSDPDFTLAKGFTESTFAYPATDSFMVVYSDSGGPDTLLAKSGEDTDGIAVGWNEYAFTGDNQICIENGETYWIGFCLSGTISYGYTDDDAWDVLSRDWTGSYDYANPPDSTFWSGATASDRTLDCVIGDSTMSTPT